MAEKEVKKLKLQIGGDEYIFAGGSSGAGETWQSEQGVATTVGGIKAGEKLNGLSAIEIFQRMLNPYQSPAVNISINPATTLYEVGSSPTITVNATLVKKTEAITAAKITKGGVSIKEASSDEISAKSFSISGQQITSDTAFSAKVSDSKGEVSGNTINVRFTRKSFYGVIGANESVTTAGQIEALGQNQLTGQKGLTWASYNANNQKVVYAYPKIFGDLTSIKDGNNFEVLSSFAKTEVTRDSVAYNVYTLKDAMSITNGKLVFS